MIGLYRFTVPILWDKKNNTIVNNESSEIIRIFNTEFNDLISPDKAAVDIYPAEHRAEIDALNEWIYPTVNSMYNSPFPRLLVVRTLIIPPQTASIDLGSPRLKRPTQKPS